MSNHSHLVYEDENGDAPKFTMELNRNIAKFMQSALPQESAEDAAGFFVENAGSIDCHLKRKENVWSNDKPSLPELGDSNDTIMKIVYTVLNPVKAGLVPLPSRWPGVKLLPTDIDKEIVVERPQKFFRRKNTKLPEKVTIRLCVPKDYGNTVEGKYNYLAKYKEHLDSEHAKIMAERKPGDRWLGVEKIKKVSPFASPKTDSPLWRLKPNFLSADKDKRIEMWKRWKSFQISYRIAFEAFSKGNREVEFPLGTYKMRLQQNVKVSLEHIIHETSPPFE